MNYNWCIYHAKHGAMSFLSASVIFCDPLAMRNVCGRATFATRATARKVIAMMEEQGVCMDGYEAVKCRVAFEVAKMKRLRPYPRIVITLTPGQRSLVNRFWVRAGTNNAAMAAQVHTDGKYEGKVLIALLNPEQVKKVQRTVKEIRKGTK